jgi:hypothetical protein
MAATNDTTERHGKARKVKFTDRVMKSDFIRINFEKNLVRITNSPTVLFRVCPCDSVVRFC